MNFPPKDIGKLFSDTLIGLTCTKIEHPSDWYWQVVFGERVAFGIETPWRLLLNGSIQFGDRDHAQKFGLPEPIDGPSRCLEILTDARVVSASLREGTGDVAIAFDNGAQLEIYNSSCGYEGWSCAFDKLNVIALGGGELAIFESA